MKHFIILQFQPTRKRAKTADAKGGGLDPTFEFGQFTQDIWADKWIQTVKRKKKITSTLDDKIKKRVVGLNDEEIEVKDEESESSSSEEDDEDEQSDEIDSDNSISASFPISSKQKLKKKTKKQVKVDDDDDDDDDILLSDDELQKDKIVVKDKNVKKGKGKKGKKSEEEEEEQVKEEVRLEDDPDYVFETNMSFQQMNLSRPLLKVYYYILIKVLYYCHFF